jgi:MFS family permease
LELGLLRNRAFSAAVTVTFTLQAVNFARLVLVPLELETVHHYSAFRVGLLLAPSAVVTAVCMKIGGRMDDRLGPRLPALVGARVMTLGTAALAVVRTTTPGWLVALALCLQAGFGLSSAGVAVAAMSDLPGELLAQAAALRNLANQVAGVVSVAGFGALLSAAGGLSARASRAQYGFNIVFVAAAVLAGIATFLATRITGDWRSTENAISPARLIIPGE